MPDQRFDREVRKELLRARATFERAQISSQWHALREASRPTHLAGDLLPAVLSIGGGGRFAGVWSLLRRYPMLSGMLTLAGSALPGARRSLWRRLLPLGVAAWVAWQVWSASSGPGARTPAAEVGDEAGEGADEG